MTSKRKSQAGFTLLELMMVVAIIAILAMVAFPNYQNYVKKSRIAEATSALSDYRVKYEQYFMDNRTWPNSAACISATSKSPVPSSFNMSCNSTASSYTITATGTGVVNGFTYTIDESNTKKTTQSPWGTSNVCWVKGAGGAC